MKREFKKLSDKIDSMQRDTDKKVSARPMQQLIPSRVAVS